MQTSLHYTYEFVRKALPEGCRSILEIGCGTGELAQMLQRDAFSVLAVDSDAERVEQARRRGVEARVLEWPCDVGRDFDAVLFTRSLHHIHELEPAIDAAVAALRPGGRVIVEDFRAEGATARSEAWFEQVVRELLASGSLARDASVEAILDRAKPAGHEHELHSSAAIAGALAQAGKVEMQDAAYYFRYVEPDVADDALAKRLLEQELALIRAGAIDALGTRFVVTPFA